MFEVIYISPSYKQSMEFLVSLANKLKCIGIDGRNIDYKNMLLVTRKFIVSAVNIFGSEIGRKYSEAEYYVDAVSGIDFKNKTLQENAMERLKYMRNRFPIDAKEISEEELIGILMEVSDHDQT